MSRIFAVFDNGKEPEHLTRLCHELLSEQKRGWPDLFQGYEILTQVRQREIVCQGFSVFLQYNPGRIKNSLADVDKKAVELRPCFLCPDNLPERQRGILYRKEYLILCNPAPVLSSHLTISHLEHRPQTMAENTHDFIQLIQDLGDAWTTLYNGPRCGASAPDHLHFQAVKRGALPVEAEIMREGRLARFFETGGVRISRAKGLGREIIVLEGEDGAALATVLRAVIRAMKSVLRPEEEVMMNIVGLLSNGKMRLLVFPRQKHRPDAFFEKGEGRIVVSPGAVEMGGIFVTPMDRDFKRLDAPAVEGILKEVCMDGRVVDKIMESLE